MQSLTYSEVVEMSEIGGRLISTTAESAAKRLSRMGFLSLDIH